MTENIFVRDVRNDKRAISGKPDKDLRCSPHNRLVGVHVDMRARFATNVYLEFGHEPLA